VLGCG
jgi:hypothetical protein